MMPAIIAGFVFFCREKKIAFPGIWLIQTSWILIWPVSCNPGIIRIPVAGSKIGGCRLSYDYRRLTYNFRRLSYDSVGCPTIAVGYPTIFVGCPTIFVGRPTIS